MRIFFQSKDFNGFAGSLATDILNVRDGHLVETDIWSGAGDGDQTLIAKNLKVLNLQQLNDDFVVFWMTHACL